MKILSLRPDSKGVCFTLAMTVGVDLGGLDPPRPKFGTVEFREVRPATRSQKLFVAHNRPSPRGLL